MHIPGIDIVGGYSLSSAPHTLAKTHEVEFCVKAARHPPAAWVHRECEVGSALQLRVGGNCYLAEKDVSSGQPVLLIAGGVGVRWGLFPNTCRTLTSPPRAIHPFPPCAIAQCGLFYKRWLAATQQQK